MVEGEPNDFPWDLTLYRHAMQRVIDALWDLDKILSKSQAHGVIPNRRYADGVVAPVRGIYESCRHLGVDFKSVELSNWLMSQQSELEYPARNITLKPGYEIHVITIDYGGGSYRDAIKPTTPKGFSRLLGKVFEERQEYAGSVVVRGYGVRGNSLWVRGEVQITIPLDFYYRRM